ncbi:MAG: GNAT family N-acetyltransferase [Victivallales bacterium]|nr:GNAT family N-acetyltransferase [Victivallales bacterium]
MTEKHILAAAADINSCTLFRSVFSGSAGEATLLVSAESDCELWLNGERLEVEQSSELPPLHEYTTLKVELQEGANVLAVRVYNLGISDFSHVHDVPGLWLEVRQGVQAVHATGRGWKRLADPSFLPCDIRVSSQLGFTFRHDFRLVPDSWQNLGFDDTGWEEASELPANQWKLIPRAIPPCRVLPPQETRLVAQGILRREHDAIPDAGKLCQTDMMHPVPIQELFEDVQIIGCVTPSFFLNGQRPLALQADVLPDGCGFYAIFDLGRETTGFLCLDVEAAEGTRIDIAHGEHLADGRVRASINSRSFCDVLLCRQGRNFLRQRFRRLGCRYLALHVTGPQAKATIIHQVSLEETLPPLETERPLQTDDLLLRQIYDTSLRTLVCCMHEHYEDCPWREQALYAYDSRNQMLYGYYVWGNSAFARHSLDLLGRCRFRDGQLRIVSPSAAELSIPSFSLTWITELSEYVLYTGDHAFAEGHRATVEYILDAALSRRNQAGLYLPPPDTSSPRSIWNFFEWVKGLDGNSEDDNIGIYNLYLCEALRSAERLFPGMHGTLADELGSAVARLCRTDTGLFRSSLDTGSPLHIHTQAMALALNLVSSEDASRIWQAILSGNEALLPISFSAFPYLLRALPSLPAAQRRDFEDYLLGIYSDMLRQDATTFWEQSTGQAEFHQAGSLCHGWSAAPVYYAKALLLGVEPLENGFRRFRVRPFDSGRFPGMGGTIPTPQGDITLSWTRRDGALELTVIHPEGTECVAETLPGIKLGRIHDLQVKLAKAENKDDLATVRTIAAHVWPLTFAPILAPAQIPYMMDMMYSPAVMDKEFDAGYTYHLLYVNGQPAGYLQWSPYHPEGTAKLHKIYLDTPWQGQGLGTHLILFGLDALRQAGYHRAVLNVNKHNDAAIRAYRRNGFTVAESVKNDIGGGFFMDDYVMAREL